MSKSKKGNNKQRGKQVIVIKDDLDRRNGGSKGRSFAAAGPALKQRWRHSNKILESLIGALSANIPELASMVCTYLTFSDKPYAITLVTSQLFDNETIINGVVGAVFPHIMAIFAK